LFVRATRTQLAPSRKLWMHWMLCCSQEVRPAPFGLAYLHALAFGSCLQADMSDTTVVTHHTEHIRQPVLPHNWQQRVLSVLSDVMWSTHHRLACIHSCIMRVPTQPTVSLQRLHCTAPPAAALCRCPSTSRDPTGALVEDQAQAECASQAGAAAPTRRGGALCDRPGAVLLQSAQRAQHSTRRGAGLAPGDAARHAAGDAWADGARASVGRVHLQLCADYLDEN
jgi:hypothetical protein